MEKENKPENQSCVPITPPDGDPAREAERAADSKAEELRASVQSKVEQGKSSLSFLSVDSEDEK